MTLVFNASPLIVLAKAGLFDQILPLASCIYIPRPVANEIARFDSPSDAACAWLATAAAQSLIVDPVDASDFITTWGLGAGESSVLAMAETLPDSIAVLDDLAARRCASALQINGVGTLGLLLMAKKSGNILTISDSLNAIVSAGLFISPKHLAQVLEKAGER